MSIIKAAAGGALLQLLLIVPGIAQSQAPDSLREQFRRSLATVAVSPTPAEQRSAVDRAKRIAAAYERTWHDSTMLRQLARFANWSPEQRLLKVRADSLRRAGFDALNTSGPKSALQPWLASRANAISARDSFGLAATLGNLGAAFALLGRPDSALTLLRQSERVATHLRDWHTLGNTLSALGALERGRGNLDGALVLFQRAAALRVRSGDDRGAAADENNLGLIAEGQGDDGAARSFYLSARRKNDAAGRHSPAATNLANLGALEASLGNLTEAIQYYRQALARHRTAGDRRGIGLDLRSLGNLLTETGGYPDAVTALQQAAEALASTGSPADAAGAYADLAQALAAMGSLGEAQRAVESGERAASTDPQPLAYLALVGGDLAVDADDYGAAAIHYQRAESLAVLAGDAYTATQAREGLGSTDLRRGNTGEAVQTLTRAVEAMRSLSDDRALAMTSLQLGAAQAADGRDADAGATIERARQIFARVGDPAGEAAALEAHARQSEQRGEVAAGESQLRAALKRLEGVSAPDISAAVRWSLGHLLRAGGNPRAAERELLLAIAANDSMGRRAPEAYAELALAQQALSKDADAFATSERLRTDAPVSLSRIASQLEADEVLIEYLVADSVTLAFVITRQGVTAMPLPVGRRSLASTITFVRAGIERSDRGDAPALPWQRPLQRLRRMLVEPIEQAGLLQGKRTLLISPHAELHYLPFAALLSADAKFLVEQFDIGYVTSASAWAEAAARPPTQNAGNASVLALAPFDRSLPGSRREVDAIKRLYGSRASIRTGSDAGRAAFERDVGQFGIVHLATYGVLNRRNPDYSYIALAPGATENGRLNVRDIAPGLLHSRLLILSACETGVGSGRLADVPAGDEWVSLVGAFLDAGAENVMATLWPIGDRATSSFMLRFHELFTRNGAVAALGEAQRQVLRAERKAPPRSWAGFVVVGRAE